MPTTRQRTAAETVERLKRKLHEYFDAASEASEHPRNVLSLVRYFVHVRHQLTDAVQHLRAADEETSARLLRQAEVAFLTRPTRFADISGRSDLIRAWTTLLVEANQKLEADEQKRSRYRASAEPRNDATTVAIASRDALDRWSREP